MTKKEKSQVILQMTNLCFHFIHKAELDWPELKGWTKKRLKKDIREAVEEIAEDYGIAKAQPVIGCIPQRNELWFSLYGVNGDDKADRDLERTISWNEFRSSIIDSDREELEWIEKRFRELADEIKAIEH